MSNFDPITYSAVNKLKPELGTMQLVPDGFVSDKYISAGSEYNSADFPLMSAAYPAGSVTVTASSIAAPISIANATTTLGTAIGCYNTGIADEYYVIFTSGDIYKIVGSAAPVFYKQLLDPADVLATINLQFLSDSLNDRVYVSTSTQTYYIDIMADFATVAVVFPGTFAPAHNSTQTNRPGVNMQFFGGKYFTIGKLTTAATVLTIVTSDDGVNFVAGTSLPLAMGTAVSMFLTGNTTVLLATLGTTAYSSVDLITWTVQNFIGVAPTIAGYAKNTNTWVANYSGVTGVSTDNLGWTAKTPNFLTASRFISTADAVLVVYTTSGTTHEINNTTTWAVSKIPTDAFSTNGGFTWLVSNNASSVSVKMHCTQMPHSSSASGAVIHKMYDFVLGQTSTTKIYEKSYTRPNLNTASYNQPVFLAGGLVGIMFDTTAFTISVLELRGVRTTDGGATWVPFTIAIPPSVFVSRFVQATTDGTKFIVHSLNNWQTYGISTTAGMHNLTTSTDGVAWTWSTNTVFSANVGLDSLLMPGDGGAMILLQNNGNMIYSIDSGNNWITASGINGTHKIVSGSQSYVITPASASSKWVNNKWETFSFPANAAYSSSMFRVGLTKLAILVNSTTTMLIYSSVDNVWVKIAAPIAFTADMVCGFYDDIFLIYNSGNLYYTTNCVNWSVKKNTAFVTLNKRFISGSTLISTLVNTSTDPNIRLFPPITSPIAGAKWVIRAKK